MYPGLTFFGVKNAPAAQPAGESFSHKIPSAAKPQPIIHPQMDKDFRRLCVRQF